MGECRKYIYVTIKLIYKIRSHMYCLNCGIEFTGRSDAKFCSPNCRVTFSRKGSLVTDNVTFSEPLVTDKFTFTVTYSRKPEDPGYDSDEAAKRKQPREAKYWYDVPLGALPILQKAWPEMPDYMNGRQYFLWWKNNFKTTDKGPELHNPFPKAS